MSIEERIEKRLEAVRTGLIIDGNDEKDVEQIVRNTREFILKLGIEIRRIIELEKAKGKLPTLTVDMWYDLVGIFETNIMEISDIRDVKLPENFRATEDTDKIVEPKKNGEFIFVAAPTGAGKDSLVVRIISEWKNGRPIVLNVDKFRHLYGYFTEYLDKKYPEGLRDKDFAIQTKDFSNDIYDLMERLVLDNFPGMDIIVTGTLRDTEWVKMLFRRIKDTPYTSYTVRLYGLVVEKRICQRDAVKRYLGLIQKDKPGTARYTGGDYINETTDGFAANFGVFEAIFNGGLLIDNISLFRRTRDLATEETLEATRLYTTGDCANRISDTHGMVVATIRNGMEPKDELSVIEISNLIDQVNNNKEYLKEQGVYEDIVYILRSIIPQKNAPQIKKPSPPLSDGKVTECFLR